MWRHLDLCAGIGGFSLGLGATGAIRTVQFVEWEPYCQRVLKRHYPEVPIHGDLKTFDGIPYSGTIDILTCGYPCQPFSQAGKRRGDQDDRHLWPQVDRVIREVRPTWIVAENVVGHISMGLDEVLSDLADAGYATEVFNIPAVAVDASHRRHRIWIIARRSDEPVANTQREGERRRRVPRPGKDTGKNGKGSSGEFGRHREVVADTTASRQNGGQSKADADANSAGLYRESIDLFREAEPADGKERDAGPVRQVLAGSGDTGERGASPVADTTASRQQAGPRGARGTARDSARREEPQRRGGTVADANSGRSEQSEGYQPKGRGWSLDGGQAVGADADVKGLEERSKDKAPSRHQRHTAERGGAAPDTRRGSREGPGSEECGRAGPVRWIPECELGGVLDGFPHWLDGNGRLPRIVTGQVNRIPRLKALGNAVVPRIVEVIGYNILAAEADHEAP